MCIRFECKMRNKNLEQSVMFTLQILKSNDIKNSILSRHVSYMKFIYLHRLPLTSFKNGEKKLVMNDKNRV